MAKQADREDNKRMDEMEIKKLQGVIEAILFTMGESVELERSRLRSNMTKRRRESSSTD